MRDVLVAILGGQIPTVPGEANRSLDPNDRALTKGVFESLGLIRSDLPEAARRCSELAVKSEQAGWAQAARVATLISELPALLDAEVRGRSVLARLRNMLEDERYFLPRYSPSRRRPESDPTGSAKRIAKLRQRVTDSLDPEDPAYAELLDLIRSADERLHEVRVELRSHTDADGGRAGLGEKFRAEAIARFAVLSRRLAHAEGGRNVPEKERWPISTH
jgi:hypothetical protein